jgi:predicted Rossmann-fold nucleotide-binding protein
MGTDYWKGLIDFIDKMAERRMISPADRRLIYATDSVEEAIAHIQSKAIEPFGLKRVGRRWRPFRWLGERALSGRATC